MKKILTLTFIVLFAIQAFCQTEKVVVIEHFTNSKCSICASRNPAFYSLLEDYPQVLHIAYHPSSPYPTCIFSQYNPEENDARTNFYGIYGGTPRVVVSGEVIPPGSQLLTADQLDSKLGMLSDYDISIKHQLGEGDNIDVIVTIKRVSGNSTEDLMFIGALAEENVDYAAPNGENYHPDVFRKFLFQEPVSLTNAGDSIVLSATYTSDPVWVQDEMHVMGMLQRTNDKVILQSAKSGKAEAVSVISKRKVHETDRLFYPNPASNYIAIEESYRQNAVGATLYNLFGQKVKDLNIQQKTSISELDRGYYFVVVTEKGGEQTTSKLLKR
ncbi:MAG TPA: T9SS type A sorting domain-containing protein [Bacteroidales bacterium]|nr:T9SS type A sorting domain-containing protein [Bacteroidales bacterium]